MLDRAALERIVDRARLAPSVHNIQPTRWSLDDMGRILLLDSPSIHLPVADPDGRDVLISHGAALEGTVIALAEAGWASEVEPADGALAAIRVARDTPADAKPEVESRASWRGSFIRSPESAALDRLEKDCPDLVLVRDPAAIGRIAHDGDEASMHFLRDVGHRRELLDWMRLTRAHPHWASDGLNAEAMALSPVEARAAGMVLGPLFGVLDRVGLARILTSERSKTASASAIALFFRPRGETPMITGRAFYRAWLAMERQGLAACPVSVLADWSETNAHLSAQYSPSDDRALLSVFRIGKRPSGIGSARSRKPIGQLITAGQVG
ncbi:hypothetical protein K9B35_03880 [Sphingomonas sp. R647]|uniref:hypothetical protein n=1 Tax=Sphingomonas sp. R647 TaxID=2875233 RepID=UPI001CD819A6|nr:hypothetical protein [Sphingomonas sp. R647]MCA1197093.1 hypothetical protein [Sphingomonas sp. R647]